MAERTKKTKKTAEPVEQAVPAETEKPKLSDMVKIRNSYLETFDVGGGAYDITFVEHIPAVERTMLLDRVESLYFVNNQYDPAYGDLSVLFILTRLYSDEEFENDIDLFERFLMATDLQERLPAEAIELFGYVQEKVDFLVKQKAVPAEQCEMYAAIKELAGRATSTLNVLSEYLDKVAVELGKEKEVSLSEVVKALDAIGRKDEKKITAAILDYQAEKAARQRHAVKVEPKEK